MDDCSRLAYSEIHDDEQAATVTAFVARALAFFSEHGIAAERLMTDNAWAYIHNRGLRELLTLRDHPHPHPALHARTNGKVERYQQTLAREWAYALQYASSQARRESLPHWVRHSTSDAPTARSATALPSTAFGRSPGSTPRRAFKLGQCAMPVPFSCANRATSGEEGHGGKRQRHKTKSQPSEATRPRTAVVPKCARDSNSSGSGSRRDGCAGGRRASGRARRSSASGSRQASQRTASRGVSADL